MKNFILILGIACLSLTGISEGIAACQDSNGQEYVFADPDGRLYVVSKSVGSGACRGCANCPIYIT